MALPIEIICFSRNVNDSSKSKSKKRCSRANMRLIEACPAHLLPNQLDKDKEHPSIRVRRDRPHISRILPNFIEIS